MKEVSVCYCATSNETNPMTQQLIVLVLFFSKEKKGNAHTDTNKKLTNYYVKSQQQTANFSLKREAIETRISIIF